MWVRWITARLGKQTTSAVIRSNPGDFLRVYFCIANLSLGVKCLLVFPLFGMGNQDTLKQYEYY